MILRRGLALLSLFVLLAAGLFAQKAPAAAPASPATAWLRQLTLRQKIAQLLVITTYGDNPSTKSKDFRNYTRWVRDLGVGGIIVANRVNHGLVVNAEPYQLGVFLNRMQRMARIPLLVSADFERGASMRVAGTVKFPHLMAYAATGDLGAAKALGAATAREARALGIHWVFAPVADVNNNPDNPIINVRSFGENPDQVAKFVEAFIEGAHADPAHYVLTTAKHFPGHGDTATDSHIGLAKIEATGDRIRAVELKPFAGAIAGGVDTIMTAHLAVPALEPEEIPATVSKNILTGVLRKELGYKGLIVTDAMDMQGLASRFSHGEAAVRALEAGADMLLMPPDPEAAINAVVAAVQKKRLTAARIDQSVRRVLEAKVRVGLQRKKLVELDTIADGLEMPDVAAEARRTAERSITLLRDDKGLVPLAEPEGACVVAMTTARRSLLGQMFLDEFRKRAPKARLALLDPAMRSADVDRAVPDPATCKTVIVATYVTAAAYQAVSLPGEFPRVLESLIKGPAPVLLVALGTPYVWRSFPDVAGFLTAYSSSELSEAAAVRALFGEIAIGGKSPVSIPPLAKVGDGMERGARVAK